MKTVLMILAACIVAAPALAITLTDVERAQCQAQGGCIFITGAQLEAELASLRARTLRECKGAS